MCSVFEDASIFGTISDLAGCDGADGTKQEVKLHPEHLLCPTREIIMGCLCLKNIGET